MPSARFALALVLALTAAAALAFGLNRGGGTAKTEVVTIGVDPQATLPEVRAGTVSAPTVTAVDSIEPIFVAEINRLRASRGLRRLSANSLLTRSATRHAKSLASVGYFRHELYTPKRSRTWTPFGTWIHWYYPGSDYRSWTAGENLAWSAPRAAVSSIMRAWMNSTAHRANLLNKEWRQIGVAVVHVVAPTGYYRTYAEVDVVVTEFGRRS
jgi:uncharacterized protein YkwD